MSMIENFDIPSAAIGFGLFAAYRLASCAVPQQAGPRRDEKTLSEEAVDSKISSDKLAASCIESQEEPAEEPLSEPEGELNPEAGEVAADRKPEVGRPCLLRVAKAKLAHVKLPAPELLSPSQIAEAKLKRHLANCVMIIFFVLSAGRAWLLLNHGASAVAPLTTPPPGLRGSQGVMPMPQDGGLATEARPFQQLATEHDLTTGPNESVSIAEDIGSPLDEPVSVILNVSTPDAPEKKRPMSITLTKQKTSVKQVGGQLEYRSAYYGKLSLGSPDNEFTFVFDTGSGHLIVPSAYCHSDTCKAHKRYKRSASKSAVDILYDGTPVEPKQPRDQMTVSFGTGEVTGVFVDEVVCLEGSNSEAAKLLLDQQGQSAELPAGCARMRIVTATEMSADPFKDFEFDGVLGLGLDGLSQTAEFNFINTFASDAIAHGGDNKMFAIFLGKDGEEKSELALGGYAEEHLDGEVHWNSVIDPEHGHWTIRIKSVRMGDVSVPFCDDGCKAVMDSGTSLMAVPSEAFSDIYKLLWHRAPLDGECRGPGPELTFELEHGSITVGPEDYARAEQCKRPKKATGFKTSGTYGDTRHDMCCRPLLMSMDMPEPVGPKLFIFGEPILRKYYTVYDAGRARIGVGKAAHQVPAQKSDVPVVDDDADDSWFWEEEDEGTPAPAA